MKKYYLIIPVLFLLFSCGNREAEKENEKITYISNYLPEIEICDFPVAEKIFNDIVESQTVEEKAFPIYYAEISTDKAFPSVDIHGPFPGNGCSPTLVYCCGYIRVKNSWFLISRDSNCVFRIKTPLKTQCFDNFSKTDLELSGKWSYVSNGDVFYQTYKSGIIRYPLLKDGSSASDDIILDDDFEKYYTSSGRELLKKVLLLIKKGDSGQADRIIRETIESDEEIGEDGSWRSAFLNGASVDYWEVMRNSEDENWNTHYREMDALFPEYRRYFAAVRSLPNYKNIIEKRDISNAGSN